MAPEKLTWRMTQGLNLSRRFKEIFSMVALKNVFGVTCGLFSILQFFVFLPRWIKLFDLWPESIENSVEHDPLLDWKNR